MAAHEHALVTGAGSGIGRAIALRLAQRGAALTLLARDTARLDETAALACERGAPAVVVRACDVSDAVSVGTAVSGAAEVQGPFSVAIANAGIGGPNEPQSAEGAADRFDALVDTNLRGTYLTLRAVQRELAPGPEPRHLVCVSSILARIGVAGYTGYCASKAGVLGLVRALAAELAPDNVQVNAVCPGWVDTSMAWEGLAGLARALDKTVDEAYAVAMQSVPLGRMSQPEDVAGLVAWLTSDDARGVTGQALDINNGAFMS